jgi:sugar lactone lactonase YvrE
MVNIAHFPWQNVEELFALSLEDRVYGPSLDTTEDVNAWTIAIRYEGNGMELDGPGNVAFDADGNAWIANNYMFQEEPVGIVCGDDHVLKFTPTGKDAPGAPYQGGGLYGAGYGITLDPDGNVWVGNFAFQGTECPLNPDIRSQSVSKFSSDGTPISPNTVGNDIGGFKGAGNTINYPQGTVSDKEGNIWIANCNGDSVTQFPGGDPDQAFVIQQNDDMMNTILVAPFDVAIDVDGNAWVTGNESTNIAQFNPEGNLIRNVSGDEATDAGFFLPMGVASDNFGNVWVANSGIITAPCDGNAVPDLKQILFLTEDPNFTGANASIAKITPDGTPIGPFKGGGILIPWGIAVDGDNNIWVSNFQGNTVTYLCGEDTDKCPPGVETGDPIAPEGYFFDGLARSTAVEIDPSGNVWATNNWEIIAVPQNPGGKQMVVFIGVAKPVRAPLIGPPNN